LEDSCFSEAEKWTAFFMISKDGFELHLWCSL